MLPLAHPQGSPTARVSLHVEDLVSQAFQLHIIAALLGFRLDRIEGSHHMLVKDGHPYTVVVPIHGSRPLPKGTLASIIRIARVGRERFFAAIG